jgi:hypothetical protein
MARARRFAGDRRVVDRDLAHRLLRLQAAYWLATGMWPLLDMRTFEWITGPKRDRWLVKTVGLLVTTIGAVLWRGTGSTGAPTHRDTLALAAGGAASLAAIDAWYAAQRAISPVYLLDAAAEVAFVAAAVSLWEQRQVG